MKSIFTWGTAVMASIVGMYCNLAQLTIGGDYESSNLVVSLVVYVVWIGCIIFGVVYAKKTEKVCIVFTCVIMTTIIFWCIIFALLVTGVPMGVLHFLYFFLYGPLAGIVHPLNIGYDLFYTISILYLSLLGVCWSTYGLKRKLVNRISTK